MTAQYAVARDPYIPFQETRRLQTDDGIGLHVELKGTGPSMLLCNGLFCSTHYFVPWFEHFSQSHRVVQWDYRSHGQSDEAPPHSVTIARLADDAAQVLRETCEGKVTLVGHSMGVRTALELYQRVPHRIARLVLLCGSAFDSLGPIPSFLPFRSTVMGILKVGDRVVPLANGLKDFTLRNKLVTTVGYMLGGMSPSLTPSEPVEGLMRNLERIDVRMMTKLGQSYIRHSARPILAHVHVPTLVLVGEKDSLAPPAHARKVVRMLPRGEPFVVSQCTHLAPVERPDIVHAAVESFLDRHSS